jgi:hypothetical protein
MVMAEEISWKPLRKLFKNYESLESERNGKFTPIQVTMHKYYQNNNSIWDLKNIQNVIIKEVKHKRNLYCFHMEIQGFNLRKLDLVRAENITRLVPSSIWALLLRNTSGHKGNYYKVFSRENDL